MDELQKAELEKEGGFTVKDWAAAVYMSEETVRRYLRKGPQHYPENWKARGVVAWQPGKRPWVIKLDPQGNTSGGAFATLETQETVLPDHGVTVYHNLKREPANIIVTDTGKGTLGPPPVVGQITASSYLLLPLTASGQVVRHTAVPARPKD